MLRKRIGTLVRKELSDKIHVTMRTNVNFNKGVMQTAGQIISGPFIETRTNRKATNHKRYSLKVEVKIT